MADAQEIRELGRLIRAAGRAHHEAIGGPNPGWPEWYARQLVGAIDDHVGFSPSVDEIAEWLKAADESHRANAPDDHWPTYYAGFILSKVETEPA